MWKTRIDTAHHIQAPDCRCPAAAVTAARSGPSESALASSANTSAAGANTMATRAATGERSLTDRNRRRSGIATLAATEPPGAARAARNRYRGTCFCQRCNLPTPPGRGNVCTGNRLRLWRRWPMVTAGVRRWIRCRVAPYDASSARTQDHRESPGAWSRSYPRSPGHRPPKGGDRHSPGEWCGR